MDLDQLIALLYVSASVLLGVFGLHRAWLLARFRWGRRLALPEPAQLPSVTVQLPLYDERAVAARAIGAAARLDYPRELLEVQVLDDSSDETRDIVEREVERWAAQGLNIVVVRRAVREGYKSGALAEGAKTARGELLCIFDADFVAEPSFLRRLVGAFADPRVGMVQARWSHLNRDQSALTRAQATLLDGHFVITHKVRFERGLFFHFNGTAGIWRRTAIADAGGWQHDTLTEDLDLSYRAQLAGWRLVYAAHMQAPAELPDGVAAFKSQQARWARGTVQVARKLLGRVWRAPIPLRVKLEATIHFVSHAGHPLVLAMGLLLPLAVARPEALPGAAYLAWLVVCVPAVLLFHERSQHALERRWSQRWLDSLLALVLGIGMSWSLARAALAGLRGEVGEFVRTPKRGEERHRSYRAALPDPAGIELVLCAWATFGLVQALRSETWSAVPFLGLYAAGFGWVGWSSLAHAWNARAPAGERVRCERASTKAASSS